MSDFRFQVLEMKDTTARQWLERWSSVYDSDSGPDSYDEKEYSVLMRNCASFSGDDFERIGKWKDSAWADGKWKPNVASVAYLIWMKAAAELPKSPEDSELEKFLRYWSEQTYTDVFSNRSVTKNFGLSRSSTLLHFLSAGQYPIFDGRVRTAISRLSNCPVPPYTIRWYLDSYLPLFRDLTDRCETKTNLRRLDKALFSYGAQDKRTFLASSWQD